MSIISWSGSLSLALAYVITLWLFPDIKHPQLGKIEQIFRTKFDLSHSERNVPKFVTRHIRAAMAKNFRLRQIKPSKYDSGKFALSGGSGKICRFKPAMILHLTRF